MRVEESQRYKEHEQSYHPEKLRTKFTKLIQELDEKEEEERQMKKEQIIELIDKRQAYGNYILEKHLPKVSEKKKKELEELKASIKPDPKKRRSKSRQDDKASPTSLKRPTTEMKSHGSRRIIKPNPLAPKPLPKKEPVIVDYLTETRRKKDLERYMMTQKSQPTLHTKDKDAWLADLNRMDLHGRERYEVYLGKAKNFEEKAERKQQILGVNPNANIEDIIELNDMYVDSIKAKLEILNDYQTEK